MILYRSLKSFKTESSIRKEVDKWEIVDCNDYIEQHKSDKSQSLLLKKKLKIVDEMLRIKKAYKTKDKQRYALLSGIKLETLVPFAPPKAQDPKGKSLRSYQKNTGVYLWKKGYDPTEFLGAGCNGVVWECDGKAIKVTCDRRYGPIDIIKAAISEVRDSQKLKALLEKDTEQGSGKKGKYLSTGEYVGKEDVGKRAIFESELATHGTLGSYAESEAYTKKVQSMGIEHIIKLLKQALKGLKVIHDAGYSHNDIKPDNLLVVEKESKNVKKNVLKVADFGAMTKFDSTHRGSMNSKFRAPDAFNFKPEAVEKRDSYSLGAVIIFILIKGKSHKEVEKILLSKGSEFVYYKYGLNEIYKKEGDKEKIIKLLNLIKKMVQPSYTKRISIKDALEEVKKWKEA